MPNSNNQKFEELFQHVVVAEHVDGDFATLIIAFPAKSLATLASGKVLNLNHQNAPCIAPKRRILVTSFSTNEELVTRLQSKGFLPPAIKTKVHDPNKQN